MTPPSKKTRQRKPRQQKVLSYADQKKLWYQKLEDSGFEDIEQDEHTLKRHTTKVFEYYTTKESWQAKAEYYQLASNFLEEYKFSAELDKVIWEYHSNGLSIRDIKSALSKVNIKLTIFAVHDTIKTLKHKMFDMYLLPKKDAHE